MKLLIIEVAIIALILFCVAAYAGEPDGSAPMPPEHRALIDPQGHLPGTDYRIKDFCHGHVKTVIKQQSGHFTIVCYVAKTVK